LNQTLRIHRHDAVRLCFESQILLTIFSRREIQINDAFQERVEGGPLPMQHERVVFASTHVQDGLHQICGTVNFIDTTCRSFSSCLIRSVILKCLQISANSCQWRSQFVS